MHEVVDPAAPVDKVVNRGERVEAVLRIEGHVGDLDALRPLVEVGARGALPLSMRYPCKTCAPSSQAATETCSRLMTSTSSKILR